MLSSGGGKGNDTQAAEIARHVVRKVRRRGALLADSEWDYLTQLIESNIDSGQYSNEEERQLEQNIRRFVGLSRHRLFRFGPITGRYTSVDGVLAEFRRRGWCPLYPFC